MSTSPRHPALLLRLILTLLLGGGLLLPGPSPAEAAPARLPSAAVIFWAGNGGDTSQASTVLAATDVVPDLLRAVPYTARTVTVAPGLAAALYAGAGFQGACVDVHGTVDLRQSIFAAPGETGRTVMPGSVVVGEDCTAPTRPAVALCGETCADVVWTDRDIRWLGPTGFNDRTAQVQVVRGGRTVHSVAVYTEADFGGTCQTITGPITDLRLPGSTVGAGQVSSLRVDATCQGPVTQPPVVTDLQVVAGRDDGVRCASGYSKSPLDLNKSMGGDYVYACLRYGPLHARMPYLGGLFAVNHPLDPKQGCERSGYRRNDQDLNAGAGGDWVYFCTAPATAVDGREVEVLENAWSVYDPADPDSACRTSARNHVVHDVDAGEVTATERDLNSWNVIEYPPPGLRSIYTCRYVRHVDPSTADAVITVPTALSTVGSTAWFRATASTPDGHAQRLTCNGASPQGALGTREGELFTLTGLAEGTTQVTCRAPGIDGTTVSRSFTVTTTPSPAPRVVATLSDAGASYEPGSWAAGPVDVHFECRADRAGGGPDIATSTVGGDARVEGPAAGVTVTSTGTCRDTLGRTAPSLTVRGINVDPTAPVVEAWPADGVELIRGTVVTPRVECVEPDSQLVWCGTIDVTEAGALPTADAGFQRWTAEGVNLAGLSGFAQRSYTVVNPRPVLESVRLTRDPEDSSRGVLEVRSASLFPDSVVLVDGAPTDFRHTLVTDPEVPGGQTVVRADLTNLPSSGVLEVTGRSPAPGGGTSVPVRVPVSGDAPVEQVTATSRSGRLVADLPEAGATVRAFADDAQVRLGRFGAGPSPVSRVPAGATGRYVGVDLTGTVSAATARVCELGGGNRLVRWDGAAWRPARGLIFDPATGCASVEPGQGDALYAAVVSQAPAVVRDSGSRVVVQHGDRPTWTASWADPEGDPLTFTATGLPSGLRLVHGVATTRLDGVARSGSGTRTVTVTATDDAGNATRRRFVLDVRRETARVTVPARRATIGAARSSVSVSAVVTQPADGTLSSLREAAPVALTLTGGGVTRRCVDRAPTVRTGRLLASCVVSGVSAGRHRVVARVDTRYFAGSGSGSLVVVRRR